MFAKVLALFALLAVAFANPKPDVLTYAAAPGLLSPYSALPYSGGYPYAAAAGYPYAAYPYGYSSYYVK